MSKTIQISLHLSDELGILSVTYMYNDTELPSNGKTIRDIGKALVDSYKANKDRLVVNDMLDSLDIDLP